MRISNRYDISFVNKFDLKIKRNTDKLKRIQILFIVKEELKLILQNMNIMRVPIFLV